VKWARRLLLVTVLLGASFVMLLPRACDLLEVPPAVTYETHADAAESVERGWLPDFLPTHARNISERHDMDSNRVCAVFELPSSEFATFRQDLLERGFARAPSATGIPSHLRGRVPCPYEAPANPPAQLFSRESGERFGKTMSLALYPDRGTIYFWTH
jgi:hypothetical protein